jgi:hypothetical protein
VAPPGIQLPGAERLFQVLLGGVDELGVVVDLVYLVLGAIAPHVMLLKYLLEVRVLGYAVEDVAEDLLLPLGSTRVAKEELPEEPVRPLSEPPPPPRKTSLRPLPFVLRRYINITWVLRGVLRRFSWL